MYASAACARANVCRQSECRSGKQVLTLALASASWRSRVARADAALATSRSRAAFSAEETPPLAAFDLRVSTSRPLAASWAFNACPHIARAIIYNNNISHTKLLQLYY